MIKEPADSHDVVDLQEQAANGVATGRRSAKPSLIDAPRAVRRGPERSARRDDNMDALLRALRPYLADKLSRSPR